MEITTFNPLIATADAAPLIELFEELGFEKRHTKKNIDGREDIFDVRMKDANGFCVDIAQVPGIQRDMMNIRMNVRDYDEAYEFLTERGFVNAQGDHTNDSGTSKGTSMIAPSGFSIALSYHRRKGDPDRA
jgi:hypothetical protein